MSLQPGGPPDVAALVALLELAPALLIVHQLIVPPLGRLVGEGHVTVAAEVLPHVPLHVVPVSVNLLHGDVGEELAALVALLVVLSNWQFNWIRIIPLNWFKKSAEKLQKSAQMVSIYPCH